MSVVAAATLTACGGEPGTRDANGDATAGQSVPLPSSDAELRAALEAHLSDDPSVRAVWISAPDEADPSTWTLFVTVSTMPDQTDRLDEFDGVEVRYVLGSGFVGS